MKKKKSKELKKEPQVIELHIYIHQDNGFTVPLNPHIQPYSPNPITNPPYIVTCSN